MSLSGQASPGGGGGSDDKGAGNGGGLGVGKLDQVCSSISIISSWSIDHDVRFDSVFVFCLDS